MTQHRLGAVTNSPHRPVRRSLKDPRTIVYKERDGDLSQVEAMATKLEASLAKAILKALNAQRDAIDVEAIAAALESGDVGRVLALLDLPKSLAALETITPAIQDGVYVAGAATAASMAMPRIAGVSFQFDRLNPRLITWLQTYSLNMIRQINDQTREGVRQFLVRGMNEGLNPKEVARQVRGIIGLTDRQAQAVKNYRKQLETFHLRRSAASWGIGSRVDRVNGTQVFRPDSDGSPMDGIDQRRLRDFRYDGQLRRAMENTKPLSKAQIDKMVAAYERKYLAYRSRTIARTEAIRTTNVGVHEAWQQAIAKNTVDARLVRRRWIVARDERTCEVCGPIPGMNPKVGVEPDKPFKTPDGPQFLPPVHPNCRCTVFYRAYEPSQLAEETLRLAS